MSTRIEFTSGDVLHYKGTAGTERMVRADSADGCVAHYEGAAGAERMVRMEFASGKQRVCVKGKVGSMKRRVQSSHRIIIYTRTRIHHGGGAYVWWYGRRRSAWWEEASGMRSA